MNDQSESMQKKQNRFNLSVRYRMKQKKDLFLSFTWIILILSVIIFPVTSQANDSEDLMRAAETGDLSAARALLEKSFYWVKQDIGKAKIEVEERGDIYVKGLSPNEIVGHRGFIYVIYWQAQRGKMGHGSVTVEPGPAGNLYDCLTSKTEKLHKHLFDVNGNQYVKMLNKSADMDARIVLAKSVVGAALASCLRHTGGEWHPQVPGMFTEANLRF